MNTQERKKQENETDPMPPFLAVLLILAFGAILAMESPNFINGFRSYFWKETRGEIIYSSIKKTKGSEKTYRSADIRYYYTVGKDSYENNTVNFISLFLNPYDKNSGKVRENPVGKKVSVYYDPEDPKSSVLYRGLMISNVISVLIDVLVILMAVTRLFQTRYEKSTLLECSSGDRGLDDILNKFRNRFDDEKIFIRPNIYQVKFKNAVWHYAKENNIYTDPPLIQIDETAMGSGKTGCLITESRIYSNQLKNEAPPRIVQLVTIKGEVNMFEKILRINEKTLFVFYSIKKESLFLLVEMLREIRRYKGGGSDDLKGGKEA